MLKAVSGVEEAQGEEGSKQGQVLNVQEAGFQFNLIALHLLGFSKHSFSPPLNILPGKISSITAKLTGFYSEHPNTRFYHSTTQILPLTFYYTCIIKYISIYSSLHPFINPPNFFYTFQSKFHLVLATIGKEGQLYPKNFFIEANGCLFRMHREDFCIDYVEWTGL